MTGWRYYYFVALAVKVPLAFWLLSAGRLLAGAACETAKIGKVQATRSCRSRSVSSSRSRRPAPRGITACATSCPCRRWRSSGSRGWPRGRRRMARSAIIGGWRAWVIGLGLAGQALAVAGDSSVRADLLQRAGRRSARADDTSFPTPTSTGDRGSSAWPVCSTHEPEFRDLTLYYFGDTDPKWYGVHGTSYVVNAVDDDQSSLARPSTATTRYLAVSASLQWGPWGPPGFFRDLQRLRTRPHDRRHHHRDLPGGRSAAGGRDSRASPPRRR